MKIIKNKFITKILLAYLCILAVGVTIASILLSNVMIDEIIEIQSKYEVEILEKVQEETDNRIKIIGKIFQNLYSKNLNEKQSLISLISEDTTQEGIENKIQQFLRYSISTSQYVSDIIFVDYIRKNVYMESESLNRSLQSEEDFYKSDIYKKIVRGENEIFISDVYKPEFLNSNEDIISIYLNLMDSNNLSGGKKYGTIIVNVKPQVFFNAYEKYAKESIGKVIVLNGKKICYDSLEDVEKKEIYQLVENENSKAAFLTNKRESSVSNLIYFSVVDTKILYKNVYDKLLGNLIAIVIICILVGIVVSIFIASIFGERINHISNHMKLIQEGNLDERMVISHNDEIGELEKNLNQTSRKIKNYIETIYVKDIKMKKAQLRSLQMQINPHFMFNTLEIIRASAVTHQDMTTARMITLLGNLFRWNLRNKDLVPLEIEMDYLESYIELQEIKNKGNIECDMDIPNELRKYYLPKLTLQPLIENAINHGYQQGENILYVEISAKELNGNLHIVINDNGKGISKEELNHICMKVNSDTQDEDLYHIGLKNIQQRIHILMGEEYGMYIQSELGKGTQIEIVLPMREVE